MLPSFSFQRTISVARKELLHIFRDPQTLFFTLVIPIVELFMLGYAIDTNVRHVRTVFVDFLHPEHDGNLDFSKSKESVSQPRLRASDRFRSMLWKSPGLIGATKGQIWPKKSIFASQCFVSSPSAFADTPGREISRSTGDGDGAAPTEGEIPSWGYLQFVAELHW